MAGLAQTLTLSTFVDQVVTTVASHLPELKGCARHGGRFTAEELRRLIRQAPAVYIALMNIPESSYQGDGRRTLQLQMTAFVVAADQPGLHRDQAAMNLTEALMLLLPEQSWGLNALLPANEVACGLPTRIRAENLYSGSLDKTKTALWGVSWRQEVHAGTAIWSNEGVLPAEVYVGVDPDIGIPHKDDYTRVV